MPGRAARGRGGYCSVRMKSLACETILHVCRVLLISAPFMYCVHHHSAEGFAL